METKWFESFPFGNTTSGWLTIVVVLQSSILLCPKRMSAGLLNKSSGTFHEPGNS